MADEAPLRSRFSRTAACVGVSLALHLLVALGLAWRGGFVRWPRLDVTWLDQDNVLGVAPMQRPEAAPEKPQLSSSAAQDPAPPPLRRKRALRASVSVRDAGGADASEPILDASPGLARADAGPPGGGTSRVALARLAPPQAALMLVLRMDRIRRSPYADAVRRLLGVFYDFKTLLWSTELDPVRDFQALLIATPNPYRVTETFLVVRHALPERRLKQAFEKSGQYGGQHLRWRTGEGGGLQGQVPSPPRLAGDPRVVVLRSGLALLTDPKHLSLLQAAAASARADAGPGSPQGLIDRLKDLHREGHSPASDPGLLLQAVNLPRLVRLPADVPVPLGLQAVLPAEAPARCEAALSFADEGQARAFITVVPAKIEQARQSVLLRLLGAVELLDALRFQRRGREVMVTATLTGDQVRGVLEAFRAAIPQVQVPGMRDRVPPDGAALPRSSGRDATASPADAGVGAGGARP